MIDVRAATEASPGKAFNEDHYFVDDDFVGVLDGVSVPEGLDTGCRHGPAWYVLALGEALRRAQRAAPIRALTDQLETAISWVAALHGDTCDLSHPGTPAATVSLLRRTGDRVDYLVLCDSPIVLDAGDDIHVLRDERFESATARLRDVALAGTSAIGSADHGNRIRDMVRAQRERVNRPDGYWIAAAMPVAARHALTGSVSLSGPGALARAAILTDGASCAVEAFGLYDWRGLLDALESEGPKQVIADVRKAERADHDGFRNPRYKAHDDATAVFCRFIPG
jgi:hypothetical protein